MKSNPKHPQALFNDIGWELFEQISSASGAGEAGFKSLYLPMAERLALFVQELPLEKDSFGQRGGALKFGLLAGLTALRLCDGVIFEPGATAQRRMLIEPQFRWAAWCAALACVPLVVAHHTLLMVNGSSWSYASPEPTLWDACGNNGSYEVQWMPVSPAKPSSEVGIVFLSRFFFPGQFGELDPTVLQALCLAINPALTQGAAEQSLSRVVRTAQEKVRLAERQRMAQVFTLSDNSPNAGDLARALAESLPVAAAAASLSSSPSQSVGASPALTLSPLANPPGNTGEPVLPAIPEHLLQWVRAVASSHDHHAAIEFLSNGEVRVSKRALNFGSTARETYEALFNAGLVVRKGESDAVLKPEMTTAFQTAMKAAHA
jgi:conjugal transfer pilus assembly protein TraI